MATWRLSFLYGMRQLNSLLVEMPLQLIMARSRDPDSALQDSVSAAKPGASVQASLLNHDVLQIYKVLFPTGDLACGGISPGATHGSSVLNSGIQVSRCCR